MFAGCTARHASRLRGASIQASKRSVSGTTGSRPRTGRTKPDLRIRLFTYAAIGGFAVTTWQYREQLGLSRYVYAEEPLPEPVFEKPRPKAFSKEENRDIISSQHLQVKRSWENPGVYTWGSNSGRVAAPESDEKFIKTPQRFTFFDGILLRDIKLSRDAGVAINERGDLLQWGTGFSDDHANPVVTLKGKDLIAINISRDRIIALAKEGTVYSVPIAKHEQESGAKASQSSWIPFWSSTSSISFRYLHPSTLAWGEKVTSIAGGQEHILMLTSKGRVFSAASGSQDFPSKGQMGISGLTWNTRPQGSYDIPHEITTLKGFDITAVAAGDYHSVALDKEGRLFTFGDNSYGQLGLDFNIDSNIVDVPVLMPLQRLYSGTSQAPRVTSVAAGGTNTYFTVDATRVASPDTDERTLARLGTVTADTWACGQGIWGNLANGRWTHIQNLPTKIPSLSGLFEYDEVHNKTIPIRLSRISVGSNYASAVMDNVTYVNATKRSSENDTNWGADIVFWGNNEWFQLGTGKRNNVNTPVYIQPLDQEAERKVRGKEEHRFQITPMKRVRFQGRNVNMEQRIECGRGVTAVYSGV